MAPLRVRLRAAILGLAFVAAFALPARSQMPTAARGPEAPTPAADSTAAAVTALANEFMFEGLRRFPELGTQLGLPIADHGAITDNSLAALREWEAREDAIYDSLGAIDHGSLRGRPEALTYGFLREFLETSRQRRVCRQELWEVRQLGGWQTQYTFMATIQPVGTAELRAKALDRYGKLPHYIDVEIEKLREGVRLGYTSPKGNVRRVIEQLDELLESTPDESPFMAMARRDTTTDFRAALAALVADSIHPAITRYRDYLRSDYLPAAREEVAVSALPEGEACYRAAVRGFTSLDIPPREIHELGLREMEAIEREMRTIAERSFGTGDVAGLLRTFKAEPRYLFRDRQEMIAYAEAAIGRAKAAMPEWFGRLPKADLVVEPYPQFEEVSAPGASYVRPPEDGSRPAIFRLNTYRAEEKSKVGAEATAFHEAIPGHHLQLALAQERPQAHPITRYLSTAGFTEGWGLYAERLADEMGLYSEDLDRMGLLSNEAFRAARLVVDPGLHVLGWSREQSIDYLASHTAMSEEEAAVEVDRYIIVPGQATAYMIGNLEIRRLREGAERELGAGFDIREFHDRVLEDGSVPLPMLGDKIERWIAGTKGSP